MLNLEGLWTDIQYVLVSIRGVVMVPVEGTLKW